MLTGVFLRAKLVNQVLNWEERWPQAQVDQVTSSPLENLSVAAPAGHLGIVCEAFCHLAHIIFPDSPPTYPPCSSEFSFILSSLSV